ncbi:MAG TPA: DoxX family protein, partial [Vicinamibacteria bacterium]|nr:DoxX family protein [Vicinamibacteria bacterium]
MAESVSEAGVAGRLQRGLLTLLRIAIGWHFLYEGHAKFMSGNWTSAGYLQASRWFLGGAFQWMASHPAVIALVDAVNIGGQILIGLLLITGTLTRAASLAGVALLLLYYLANPPLVGLGLAVPADGHYLVVDRNLIEMLTLAFLAALPVTALPGVDRWFVRRRQVALAEAPVEGAPKDAAAEPVAVQLKPARGDAPGRREMLANLAGLPFLGAFAYALFKKRQWSSYEERNLVDAVTAASTKTLDVASLRDLKGALPMGKIGGKDVSRLILGGNLLSGWAHSRDLIYVSQLVKAYHNKDRIFATLLMAEKC